MPYVDPWASKGKATGEFRRSEVAGGSVEESNRSIIGSLLHGAGVALDAPYKYVGAPVERAIFGTLREGLIDTGASDWMANHDWNKKNDVKGVKRPGFNIKEALGLEGNQGATLNEVIHENPETFPSLQSNLGTGLEFLNRLALDPLNMLGTGTITGARGVAAAKVSAAELGPMMIERARDAKRGLTIAQAQDVEKAAALILKEGKSAQKLTEVKEAMKLVGLGDQAMVLGRGKAAVAIPGTQKIASVVDTAFTGGPLKGKVTEFLAKKGSLEHVRESGFSFQAPTNRDLRQAIMRTLDGDAGSLVLHQASTRARRQGVGDVSTALRNMEEDGQIRFAKLMGIDPKNGAAVRKAVQGARKEFFKDADRGAARAMVVVETGKAKTAGEKLIKAMLDAGDNTVIGDTVGLRGLRFVSTTGSETVEETMKSHTLTKLKALLEGSTNAKGFSGVVHRNLSDANALSQVLGAADDLAKAMWAQQQGVKISKAMMEEGWRTSKVGSYAQAAGVLHAYTLDMEKLAKDLDLQERIGLRFKGLKADAVKGRQEAKPFVDTIKERLNGKDGFSAALMDDAAKVGKFADELPAAEVLVKEGLPQRTRDLVELTGLASWDDVAGAIAKHERIVAQMENLLPKDRAINDLLRRREAMARSGKFTGKIEDAFNRTMTKLRAENEAALVARKQAVEDSFQMVVQARQGLLDEFGSIRNALSDEALATMQGAEKLTAVIKSETEYWRNLVQMYGEAKTSAEDTVQTILGRQKDVAALGGRDVAESLSDSLRAQSVELKKGAADMARKELNARFKKAGSGAERIPYKTHRAGWKLHLNVGGDTVRSRKVSEVLKQIQDEEDIVFKQGHNSGQTGKDFTVYVGDKTATHRVAAAIEDRLGSILDDPVGDALVDDVPFTKRVVGRFDAQQVLRADGDSVLTPYGSKGHGLTPEDMAKRLWDKKNFDPVAAKARAEAAIRGDSRLKALYDGLPEEARRTAMRSGADVYGGKDADLRFIQTVLNLQGRQMVDLGYGTVMDADVIKYIGRMATAEDATRVFADFNRVTNVWRSQILALPGFSNRNWIGGFLGNWQDGIRLRTYSDSSDLFKAIDKFARDLSTGGGTWTPTPKDLKLLARYNMTPEQAVNLVQEIGFQFSRDLGAVGPLQAGPFMSRLEQLQGYMDQRNPFTVKAAATLGKATGVPVEMNLRMSHVMGLMEQGIDHTAAMNRMYLLHNDYSDLSKFDIQAKRFFPFWVWRSRNLPLQAHLLATTNYLGRALQMEAFRSQEIAAADGDAKPPFLGISSIALGNRSFGTPGGIMGSADFFDTIGDVATGVRNVNPSAVSRAILQPESAGPVFKVPTEVLITGRDMFTDKKLFENGAVDVADYTKNQIPILSQIYRTAKSPSLKGAGARVGSFAGFPVPRSYEENG